MRVTLVYPGTGVHGFGQEGMGSGESLWIHHGLALIGANLKKHGHDVDLIDMRLLAGWDQFRREVRGRSPRVLGITVSCLDLSDAAEALRITKEELPNCTTVAGGVVPSIAPEECARRMPHADFVVSGEGESVMVNLVEGMERRVELLNLQTLGPPHLLRGFIEDPDALPYADRDLFDYQREMRCGFGPGQDPPVVTMVAGRGCPYACRYCLDGDTLIWMADHTWKALRNVRVGDHVVGLQKDRRGHALAGAVVQHVFRRKAATYRMVTDRSEVVTTAEHPWLAYANHSRWRTTQDLRTGDRIHWVVKPVPAAATDGYKKGYIGNSPATVLSIEPVGEREVFNIATTTENYVANGLASHNCQPAERKMFPGKFRIRSVDHVLGELELLAGRYSFQHVTFWDDTFTADKRWVRDFCERYIERGFTQRITGCCRADIAAENPGLIELMARAGVQCLALGFETGTQRLLDMIGKGVTLEQNYRAAELLHQHGIKVFGTFMVGLPTETNDEARATIEMMQALRCDHAMVFWFNPIPGTHMYDDCVRDRIILREDPFDINRTDQRTPTIQGPDYEYLRTLA